jgi:hypothetical protein
MFLKSFYFENLKNLQYFFDQFFDQIEYKLMELVLFLNNNLVKILLLLMLEL